MTPTKNAIKLKMRASCRLEYIVMISPSISAFLAYNKESQHDNNSSFMLEVIIKRIINNHKMIMILITFKINHTDNIILTLITKHRAGITKQSAKIPMKVQTESWIIVSMKKLSLGV